MERDADFLHKKAERATLRVCLREKYRLPKVYLTQSYIHNRLLLVLVYFSFNERTILFKEGNYFALNFIHRGQKSSTEDTFVGEYSSKAF